MGQKKLFSPMLILFLIFLFLPFISSLRAVQPPLGSESSIYSEYRGGYIATGAKIQKMFEFATPKVSLGEYHMIFDSSYDHKFYSYDELGRTMHVGIPIVFAGTKTGTNEETEANTELVANIWVDRDCGSTYQVGDKIIIYFKVKL